MRSIFRINRKCLHLGPRLRPLPCSLPIIVQVFFVEFHYPSVCRLSIYNVSLSAYCVFFTQKFQLMFKSNLCDTLFKLNDNFFSF